MRGCQRVCCAHGCHGVTHGLADRDLAVGAVRALVVSAEAARPIAAHGRAPAVDIECFRARPVCDSVARRGRGDNRGCCCEDVLGEGLVDLRGRKVAHVPFADETGPTCGNIRVYIDSRIIPMWKYTSIHR